MLFWHDLKPMPPNAHRSPLAVSDPRLRPFLEALTDADADHALARLMEEAAPVMTALLQRKRRGRYAASDAEDVASEARTQLVVHLQRLRAAPDDLPPIADFRAYAATVAFTAWAADLRQRHPGRAMLLNRLRYLLENRTNQRGFSLWTGPGGEPLAGFAVWRTPGNGATPTLLPERHQLLRADPRAAAAGAFRVPARDAGGLSLPLAEQVAGLLSWLGGPLPLRELTDALAELRGAATRPEPLPAEDAAADDPMSASPADPRPSPHDELRWKEYLLWLWREVARLTLRQRSAFLFHSNCLREMELLGLASVRQAAEVLEVPPERMAEYWNLLPLEDRAIAALLGLECQQVINLRKAARGILGRAWRQWLDQK